MKTPLIRNDYALDARDHVVDGIVESVEAALSPSDLERAELRDVFGYLEVLYGIANHCGQNTVSADTLARWSERILSVFDADPRITESTQRWRAQVIELLERLKLVIQ